jgi:Tol biopolymer transport system component
MTTDELERQLRVALRETFDREQGPNPTWADSPAARRTAEFDRNRRRWSLRLLAVAAVLGAAGGAALLAGVARQPADHSNGWVVFTVAREDPAGGGPDTDIWFAALDQEPRRAVGADTDSIDQLCPAFSPDGHSLAYGSVEGVYSTQDPAGAMGAYQNAALVIADVADDGTVAARLTVDIGDRVPPPCPVWSPDGDQLAFGVPLTSPINPLRSGKGSEVWILRPADGRIAIIPDLLATDLEWSPDSAVLAIVGGVETTIDGLLNARIRLYEPSTGTQRTLDDTVGVSELTWSPDGARIAYATGQPTTGLAAGSTLRVIELETGHQEVLTTAYSAIHGIGPVWSPDGKTIAYQRRVGSERHEVVLVTPDERSAQTGLANEVVMPTERAIADGSSLNLYPWRVTWSPDGTYLLYVAWTFPNEADEETWVVAVPIDQDATALVLADVDGILSYDSGETMRVPIQIWGRLPSD